MHHAIVWIVGIVDVIALVGTATTASAQEGPRVLALTEITPPATGEAHNYLAERVLAPSQALELKVASAYTQGFGNIAPGRTLPDVAGAGIAVGVDVDYRMTREWSIGVEGQYQELANEQNTSSRGLAGNVGATYHFDPILRGDPWIRLGTGFRSLWENGSTQMPTSTVARYGFEAVAAKIGYDIRVSEDVALSPVIGADLNVFAWDYSAPTGNQTLPSAAVATFIYAGLQGRFDVGGRRDDGMVAPPAPEPVVAAPEPVAPARVEPPPRQVAPSIAISDELLLACKSDLGEVDKAPKFEFDRAELLPADFDVLRMVAVCFTTGPMKGEMLRLVGRADPRGTIEYNQLLGAKRAEAAAAYLESQGVDTSNIEEVSRGKLDALGTDEETWARDRRVDVLLAGH